MSTIWWILIGITVALYAFYLGRAKTWGCRLRLTLIPMSLAVSILFLLYIIIPTWNYLGIDFKNTLPQPTSLIIHLFLIEYILLGCTAICWTAWKKRGFSNLKKKNGLIAGLMMGLMMGFIVGFIVGLIVWLIVWLMAGLIVGFIVWLMAGLIAGLIAGLENEFKK